MTQQKMPCTGKRSKIMQTKAKRIFIVFAAALVCSLCSCGGSGSGSSSKKSVEGYWSFSSLIGSGNLHFDKDGQLEMVGIGVGYKSWKVTSHEKGTYSVAGNKIIATSAGEGTKGLFSDLGVKDGDSVEFYMPNADTLELCAGGNIMVFTRTNDYVFRNLKKEADE